MARGALERVLTGKLVTCLRLDSTPWSVTSTVHRLWVSLHFCFSLCVLV